MHSANAEAPFTDWKPPSAVNREKEAQREREQELLEKKEALEAAEPKAGTDGERDVHWLDGIRGLFEAHREALSDLASLSGDSKGCVNPFAFMDSSMFCPNVGCTDAGPSSFLRGEGGGWGRSVQKEWAARGRRKR